MLNQFAGYEDEFRTGGATGDGKPALCDLEGKRGGAIESASKPAHST
jgi:hypothetical protein